MSIVKYDDITKPFEMENGAFSLVNVVFLLCLQNIPPGIKGRIAVALFCSIVQNVYSEGEENGQKRGSRWSPALSLENIIAMVESTPGDKKQFEYMKNNFRNYVNELLENNMFYRFGKTNHFCYFYEKNLLSWQYLWNKKAYVYPVTVKKLLDSIPDLWDFYWHDSDGDLSIGEFYFLLASMISDVVSRFHPSLRHKYKLFDKNSDNPIFYLKQISTLIQKEEDLSGLDSLSGFEFSRLPMSVQEKFAEIIPDESKEGSAGFKPSFNKTSRGALRRIRDVVMINYSKVRDLHEIALNVEGDPNHLLYYLEMSIKTIKRISDKDTIIYKNIGAEKEICNRIHDALREEGVLTGAFIRSWIDWFVRDRVETEYNKNKLISSELLKSLKRYLQFYRKSEESIIFDDVNKMYMSDFSLEDACKKYGLHICYNFLFTKTGRKEADDEIDCLLSSIEKRDESTRKNVLFAIMSSTMSHGDQAYKINLDGQVYKKFKRLLDENGCSLLSSDMEYSPANEDVCAFWRKVDHEYKQRPKSKDI